MERNCYICSYCKTGVMNTSDQYYNHISGVKHKKKAFNMQAPHDGIEYKEFWPDQPKKLPEIYVPQEEDFPSLSQSPAKASPSQSKSSNIWAKPIKQKEPVIVISDSDDNDGDDFKDQDENEDYSKFPSIDDLYNHPETKPSSAYYSIEKYLKHKSTAAQALNEVAQNMDWELKFELATSKTDRYKYEVYASNILIGEGEGENKKAAKQDGSAAAIKDIKRRLEAVIKGNKADKETEKTAGNNDPKTNGKNDIDHPADAYRKLAFDKLTEIEFAHRNACAVPRRFAAFILTDQPDQRAKDGVVVAFGAGEGRLSDTDLKDICMDHGFENLPGYFIRNFDCLVLAKRSLQCFLYNQLLMFFDSKRADSRREKNYLDMGKNGYVTFKDGVRLHLYLSHAPYGDCTESIPSNFEDPEFLTRKEADRDKNGKMEPLLFMTYSNNQYIKQPGHIRVWNNNDSNLLGTTSNRNIATTSTTNTATRNQGKWVSVLDYRSKTKHSTGIHLTMSPTDKLTYWIHAGIQGALLSHLMAPIYLYSIQIGKDYMHQHISRALLCRVPLDSLKEGYGSYYKLNRFKDPFLERVHQIIEHPAANRYVKNLDVSFNWYLNPITNGAEVIDNTTGCVHVSSPFKLPYGSGGSATGTKSDSSMLCSRLSKVCMLIRLRNCMEAAVNYYARKPEFRRNRDIQGIYDAAKYDYGRWKVCANDYRRLKWTIFDLLRQKRYGDWQPNEGSNKFNLLDMYELHSVSDDSYDDDNYVSEKGDNVGCKNREVNGGRLNYDGQVDGIDNSEDDDF